VKHPRQIAEEREKLRKYYAKVQEVEPLLRLAREPLFVKWAADYEQSLIDAILVIPAADHEERYAATIALRTVRDLLGYIKKESQRSHQAKREIELINETNAIGGGNLT
jgi:hypothetical protein